MEFIRIDHWPPDKKVDYRPQLESGNVLFFPKTPFPFPEDSQEFLRGLSFAGGAVHKNVAYKPALDRVTGVDADDEKMERLRAIMREYSRAVVGFTAKLLPQYALMQVELTARILNQLFAP